MDSVENWGFRILSRVILRDGVTLPADVALEFLRWGFSEADQRRMSELAFRAREGSLKRHEQAEADSYERVASFLGHLKSQARRSLRSA